MKLIIETGTDVASLAAADRTVVAELHDAGSAMVELADEAEAAGRLWRAATGADGGYLLHVFIDEEPAPELAAFLHEPIEVSGFPVPSGSLLIGGEEYVVAGGAIEKYPHMAAEVEVPPGVYRLVAYRTEYEAEHEERFAKRASPAQQKAVARFELAMPLALLVTLCCVCLIPAMVKAYVPVRTLILPAGVFLAAWVVVWRFTKAEAYASGRKIVDEIARELPSVVLHLTRTGDVSCS